MLLAFHVHDDDEPTWAPLERLRALADHDPTIAAPEVESYMYMGKAVSEEGPVSIHLYKHRLTRLYLNLDDECRPYRFAGVADDDLMSSFYEPIDDLAAAIDHAQGEAESLRRGLMPGNDGTV